MFDLPVNGRNGTYRVRPTKIICVGRNYVEHVEEGKKIHGEGEVIEIPEEPVLFPKFPNTLIPDGEAIQLPLIAEDYDFEPRTDYEGELAVIIGRRCKHLSEEEALSAVLGYTCLNDIGQRNIQKRDKSGWFRGKSFDTFAPLGPAVTLAEDLEDPQNLDIRTILNGSTVQESNTKHMIFSLPVLLAYISRNFTLEEGDIIATGTPAGVGPLKEGDTVQVEISRIGTLTNHVMMERMEK